MAYILVLQIKKRAREAEFDFNSPEWAAISDGAKDLLRKLIVRNPAVCVYKLSTSSLIARRNRDVTHTGARPQPHPRDSLILPAPPMNCTVVPCGL